MPFIPCAWTTFVSKFRYAFERGSRSSGVEDAWPAAMLANNSRTIRTGIRVNNLSERKRATILFPPTLRYSTARHDIPKSMLAAVDLCGYRYPAGTDPSSCGPLSAHPVIKFRNRITCGNQSKEGDMRKLLLLLLAVALVLLMASVSFAGDAQTVNGWISDSK